MNIKFIDFIKFIDTCKSLPELKIKCDLLYGIEFYKILDKFCSHIGYQISDDFLLSLNIQNLSKYLIYLGKSFEERNKIYIQKSTNFESSNYTRYIVEYYLPDCFKLENISINI